MSDIKVVFFLLLSKLSGLSKDVKVRIVHTLIVPQKSSHHAVK